uniref:Uncharacterized protein n=1 Tax=Anopheles christyi TaxID=43041 RepID=A0A182KAS6_9DIPT
TVNQRVAVREECVSEKKREGEKFKEKRTKYNIGAHLYTNNNFKVDALTADELGESNVRALSPS